MLSVNLNIVYLCRYEKKEFQRKVSEVFDRIYDSERNYWHEIDARISKDLITNEITEKALQVLREVQDKPLIELQ